ncbi:Uma2 family endonuclease [Spirosoma foliorum]|uniref:Uma2 family endonuclease n=1 Tax=Spirosoma foliorum TaxID=2710596 RepID=A0A7G5GS27_9BACT|nr:Uma2 family endonuclease [Spirosoma foliorum]QMW01669.1 Uma2 family endonuclease [Spirosoma foliorum]
MQSITLTIPPNLNVFSDDELYAFCLANPELRIERDETGHIIIMPPTGLESSFTNGELFGEVRNWNRQTKAGRTSESNGGYTLPDKSMRAPDVGWVSKERLMGVLPEELKKFAHVCPDFVIEVRSESDNLSELQAKMQKWLQNGVRLGWLVDPQVKTTTIYRPGQDPLIKPFTETLSGEDVLIGFTMNVAEVLTY